MSLIKKPESEAERKLVDGIVAGEALVVKLKKLEAENPDAGCDTDPVTGQKFLTSKDLHDLVEFDKKVRAETGHPFFDWSALKDLAFTEYHRRMDEIKKSKC